MNVASGKEAGNGPFLPSGSLTRHIIAHYITTWMMTLFLALRSRSCCSLHRDGLKRGPGSVTHGENIPFFILLHVQTTQFFHRIFTQPCTLSLAHGACWLCAPDKHACEAARLPQSLIHSITGAAGREKKRREPSSSVRNVN